MSNAESCWPEEPAAPHGCLLRPVPSSCLACLGRWVPQAQSQVAACRRSLPGCGRRPVTAHAGADGAALDTPPFLLESARQKVRKNRRGVSVRGWHGWSCPLRVVCARHARPRRVTQRRLRPQAATRRLRGGLRWAVATTGLACRSCDTACGVRRSSRLRAPARPHPHATRIRRRTQTKAAMQRCQGPRQACSRLLLGPLGQLVAAEESVQAQLGRAAG